MLPLSGCYTLEERDFTSAAVVTGSVEIEVELVGSYREEAHTTTRGNPYRLGLRLLTRDAGIARVTLDSVTLRGRARDVLFSASPALSEGLHPVSTAFYFGPRKEEVIRRPDGWRYRYVYLSFDDLQLAHEDVSFDGHLSLHTSGGVRRTRFRGELRRDLNRTWRSRIIDAMMSV